MKYKVGDIIITNEHGSLRTAMHNKRATIVKIDNDETQPYLLHFDDYVGGHDGDGTFEDGYCWWVSEKAIRGKLCASQTNELKVGDRVKIVKAEYRKSYDSVIGCIGDIVDIEYNRVLDDEHTTYRVRIEGVCNKWSKDGLWIFNNEKSLELYKTQQYIVSVDSCDSTPYTLYRPSNIGNVWDAKLNDYSQYIDDLITHSVNNKTSEIKTFNIGENKMNSIVEIYRDKKYEKMVEKNRKEIDKLKLADENYKVYKECVDKLLPIYEKTKQTFHDITEPLLTEETLKKCAEWGHKLHIDEDKLNDEIDEINAQLSMCETYEQKQSVLKLYKVIDENGKINA